MPGLARPFGGLGKFYLFKILVCWRLVPDGVVCKAIKCMGWVSFIYLRFWSGTRWRGLQGNKMHGLARPFGGLGKFYLFKILVCRRPVPDCQASKMPILVKSVLVLFNIATSIIQYAWMCYAI